MTIVPDEKDWTWVLERPCPECGLDTRGLDPGAVSGLLRANAQGWPPVLAARIRAPGRRWSTAAMCGTYSGSSTAGWC
jgi:hypothetical protein